MIQKPTLYEYGFINFTASFKPDADFAKLTDDQTSQQVAMMLGSFGSKITSALTSLDNGTWQAISHNIVVNAGKVWITVMTRRLALPPTTAQRH